MSTRVQGGGRVATLHTDAQFLFCARVRQGNMCALADQGDVRMRVMPAANLGCVYACMSSH